MGKYDYMTDAEKDMIGQLGEAYRATGITTWLPMPTMDESYLDGGGGEHIDHVPGDRAFYIGLAEKAFLTLWQTPNGSLQIEIQQPTIDYADYAAKSPLRRRWEDLRHYLGEKGTPVATFLWLLAGAGLVAVAAIGLRLLGWIRIGN